MNHGRPGPQSNIYRSNPGLYILIVLYATLLTLKSGAALAQIYPKQKELYVNDYISLLSVAETNRIRQKLKKHYGENKTLITLVIISRRSAYGMTSLENFAYRLLKQWKIETVTKNKGVLILIAKDDRQIRIELGSSYGQLRNSLMKNIIDNTIVPHFENDDYVKGIETGIATIIAGLSDPVNVARSIKSDVQNPASTISNQNGTTPVWLIIVLSLILIFVVWYFMKRYLRYRPRSCRHCKAKMHLLNEKEDDHYLDEGSLMEEIVQSADYDVWRCAACDFSIINRHAKADSGFTSCSNCNYNTLESKTTVTKIATEYATGTKQIDYICAHCNHTTTEYKTIPRWKPSNSGAASSWSNSSSSSNASWSDSTDHSSDDSSSGGGASGSW